MADGQEKRLLELRVPFEPKTYDIDYVGHVSNIVYVRWLEDLRLAWLNAHFPLEEQAKEGFAPVLLRTEIDYIRQIKMHDKDVFGSVWIMDLGRIKWTIGFEFTCGSDIVARATQVGIFFDTQKGKPIRSPKNFTALLELENNKQD